jgi:hypothetical protein
LEQKLGGFDDGVGEEFIGDAAGLGLIHVGVDEENAGGGNSANGQAHLEDLLSHGAADGIIVCGANINAMDHEGIVAAVRGS